MCNFTYTDEAQGMIDTQQMKNYAERYDRNADHYECVWHIQTVEDMQVRLFLDTAEFSLAVPNDCGENFMEVYAGTTAGHYMKR